MEVRIYRKPHPTNAVEVLLITQRAVGGPFTIKHYGLGLFSVQIPTAILPTDIAKGDVVSIDRTFYGRIDSIVAKADEKGDVTTLSGYDLKGLLYDRQIVPTDYTSVDGTAGYDARTGPTETIIKGYISSNLSNPPQTLRKIPNFTLATDLGRGVASDKYMARFDVLSDVVTEMATDAELGWFVTPVITEGQPFGFLFDCVVGVDRTAGQTTNSPAIFEIQRRNVSAMEYKDSDENYSNAFYTTKSGAAYTDEALTLLYWRDGEDQPSGIDRKEKWLNVSVGNIPSGSEYAEMRRKAVIQMQNYDQVKSFTANVTNSGLIYGVDYALGDKVTVKRLDWGVALDTVITDATFNKSGDGTEISLTFGNTLPNVFKRMQKSIKELA